MKTVIICLLIIFNGFSISGLNPDGSLDQDRIYALYFDGNFEEVRHILETFRKEQPSPSENDKVFMYKYLGIVYAANPETRDQAESYLYQLLKLKPTIEVLDMYISENIKVIFKNVKKDYELKMKYLGKENQPDSLVQTVNPEPGNRKETKPHMH